MTVKFHRPLIVAAAEALVSIFRDFYHADKVIEKYLKQNKKWGARDRRFFAETVYDITRWWRKIAWSLRAEDSQAEGSQRKDLGSQCGPYPDFNVQLALQFVEAHLLFHHQDLFIKQKMFLTQSQLDPNSIKKYLLRWENLTAPAEVRHSLPDWLEELGVRELGARWPGLIAAMNQPAPVFLRVNRLKAKVSEVQDLLAQDHIQTDLVEGLSEALRLIKRANVFKSQAFQMGLFEMQDGGSQQVAPFLNPQPGERIVDGCAGAGGKTLHLAALMGNKGKILALDVDEKKLQELTKRTRRAGVHMVEVKKIDSPKTIKRLREGADRVLLDVPCSGSGIWRRNPDSRWKMSEEKFQKLLQLQREILLQSSKMVKKGGILVYSTCSVFPSENQRQIKDFIKLDPRQEWSLQEELHIFPDETPFDGFYCARLRREG